MSNLLDKASILLTPTAYSSGDLHCIKPNTSTGDFDFTRGTTATRVGSNGLIQNVASGLPRIDFSGNTAHLLIEPQSTNLEVNSGDLSTGWGVASSATQQVETGITPFGVSGNIKRLTGATNNPPNWVDGADSLRKQYTVTATNPASFFTFSVYVKSAGSTTVNIQLRDNTLGPSVTTGLISLNSDWQRVSITKQFGTTTTKVAVVIGGTNGDILLSGAQLENQDFATSLMPTSGITATRDADLANGSGNTTLINTVEGVIYTETACLIDGTQNRAISIGSDGQNYASIQYNPTSNRILGRYRNAGNFECQIQFDVSDRTQFSKIAFRFKQDDFALFVDGVKVGTDTNGNVLSADTFTNLALNSGITGIGQPFEGKIKCIAVYKDFLTDSELIALTS